MIEDVLGDLVPEVEPSKIREVEDFGEVEEKEEGSSATAWTR